MVNNKALTEKANCVECGKEYERRLKAAKNRGISDIRSVNRITCSQECSKKFHKKDSDIYTKARSKSFVVLKNKHRKEFLEILKEELEKGREK